MYDSQDELAAAQERLEFHRDMFKAYESLVTTIKKAMAGKRRAQSRQSRRVTKSSETSQSSAQPLFSSTPTSSNGSQVDNQEFLLAFVREHSGTSQKEITDAFERAQIATSRNYVS